MRTFQTNKLEGMGLGLGDQVQQVGGNRDGWIFTVVPSIIYEDKYALEVIEGGIYTGAHTGITRYIPLYPINPEEWL